MIGIAAWSPLVLNPPIKDPPPIEAFLEHMDYISNLVGVDHIGIGIDISEGMSKSFSMRVALHIRTYIHASMNLDIQPAWRILGS